MEENRNSGALGSGYGGVPAVRLDADIPDEIVPLPSGGKVYPVSSPLHGRNTIEIKVMTTHQENILTNRALIKKGTVLTELIKSCMVDRTIDVGTMLSGDRNAIMVALRITGYGSEYGPLEVECQACGHKNKEHNFSLASLPLKTLDVDPVVPFENKFEFTLPQSGLKVYFKLLTGHDEDELSKTIENTSKLGDMAVQNITHRLKAHILQIGDAVNGGDIDKAVKKMRAGDSKALRKYIDKITPTIDMTQEYECPSCGDMREVDVPLTHNFFWPD